MNSQEVRFWDGLIAAGSLFTSCVENTEPQGIKDLRLAKADYLDALSNLRAADAEKVKAEAALVQAQAATEQARAALKQAYVKAKELENEKAALQNEEEAARVAASIDSIIAKAEQDAVVAQKNLAEKQAELDSALRKIAAESIGLTQDEKDAISEATGNLNIAYGNYNWALAGVNAAQYALWNAEYDAAAGVVGYETADSYRDSIAAEEEVISLKKASIATLEAIKLAPEFAKDSIEANNAKIKELEGEKLVAESEKTLYEATTLYEANKAYAKKVEAFKKDSVGKAPAYLFATITEKKDTVKVEYPLTNGKRLDAKFASYVNNVIKLNEKTAKNYGIEVGKNADDKWNILVGGKDVKKEDLDTAQAIIATIVEALNRDLVVVNDSIDAKNYEGLVEAAEAAKKAYETDRDTLSKGLSKYQPYIDSVAKIAILVQDTVDAKANFVEADSIYTKVAKVDSARKDAAQIVEVKKADTVYKAAVKDLFSAVDNYALIKDAAAAPGSTRKVTTSDSTKFVAAINAFGSAQAAFLGKQDSLTCWKGYDPETGDPKQYKEALSEISLANFRIGKDGNVAYRETEDGTPTGFKDVLTKISNGALADVWSGTEAQWIDAVDNVLKGKTSATDSVDALKGHNPAVKAAVEAFGTSKKVAHEKDSLAKALKVKFTESVDKCENYEGGTDAKNAYLKVVSRFWGRVAAEKDTAAVEFTWTEKTFFEPENCVVFSYHNDNPTFDRHILYNDALRIALEGVDKEFDFAKGGVDYGSKIFWGGDENGRNGKRTEFALAIFAQQLADDAADYEFLEDQLENINTQVAAIKDDVAAYNAEYAAADKAYKDALVALTGKGKAEVAELSAANVKDGKWNLAGKQLEFANELAAEYPALVKEVTDKTTKLNEAIDAIHELNKALNEVAVEMAKYVDTEHVTDRRTWNVGQIIAKVDRRIEKINKEIEFCEGKIAGYAKLVAACEAGYSPAEVKIEFYEGILAAWENLLEQAEFELALAQKAYDEVIAKYGVTE